LAATFLGAAFFAAGLAAAFLGAAFFAAGLAAAFLGAAFFAAGLAAAFLGAAFFAAGLAAAFFTAGFLTAGFFGAAAFLAAGLAAAFFATGFLALDSSAMLNLLNKLTGKNHHYYSYGNPSGLARIIKRSDLIESDEFLAFLHLLLRFEILKDTPTESLCHESFRSDLLYVVGIRSIATNCSRAYTPLQ
jgi:hypothetical protein